MALPPGGRTMTAPHTGQLTDNMESTVVGGCERISHTALLMEIWMALLRARANRAQLDAFGSVARS
jgi:hypothetical protein